MVIFQDQNTLLLQRGEFVQKHPNGHFQRCRRKRRLRNGGEGCESSLPKGWPKDLASRHNVAPETDGIVIPTIERNPGDWWQERTLLTISHPVTYQGGFAKAGWS